MSQQSQSFVNGDPIFAYMEPLQQLAVTLPGKGECRNHGSGVCPVDGCLWVAAAINVDNEEHYDLEAEMPTDEELRAGEGGWRRGFDGQDVFRTAFPCRGGSRLPRWSSTTGPSIFAHAGVRTPPAVLDAQLREAEPLDGLTPILEHRGSVHAISGAEAGATGWQRNPLPYIPASLAILQHGLLA
ncbi:hypothetical protein V8E55_007986 [Tylopilus felleus]